MTSEQTMNAIKDLLATFCDFEAGPQAMGRFFTQNYQQSVDGKVIDLSGFMDHVRALHTTLVSIDIEIQQIVSDGVSAATVHVVHVAKRNGEMATVKVIAFYRFDGERITSIDELTHVLKGHATDRELGSMRSQ